MIYGSVCSGIEAASVSWEPLGWSPAFFSEIEAFPRAVLAHHYGCGSPNGVPLHGDFTTIEADQYEPIDLLVGGTPCQDFSIAGLRAGITGDRGNLTLEFVRLAARLRPRWIVWENVPGVLSSDGGRAFGSFLGGLGVLGYGFAYRVLDAQFAGLAQRRERVFVVGYLGDWRRAAAVLFEQEGLRWNPPPRRSARPGTTVGTLGGTSPGGGWRIGPDEAAAGHLIPAAYGGNNTRGPIDVATALSSHGGPHGRLDFESETFIAHSLRAEGFDASEDGTGRGTPIVPVTYSIMPQNSGKDYRAREVDVAQPLMAGGPVGGQLAVAYGFEERARGDDGRGYGRGPYFSEEQAPTINTVKPPSVVHSAVRRLTPAECEKLQGFPDGYTDAPYRGKSAADGPRYKALGNSMAVPVMRWIGERIQMVEQMDAELRIAAE